MCSASEELELEIKALKIVNDEPVGEGDAPPEREKGVVYEMD